MFSAAANPLPLRLSLPLHMIGLSGGGWTTTLYAALDPRIQCSFSVAGTMPLYLRSGGSIGDREQFEPTFYRLATTCWRQSSCLNSENRVISQMIAEDCGTALIMFFYVVFC